ncbi:MAG: 3-dehydroquinate synthase [Clostridia bacterium]|nr:3-dehydroquinate synthase [Clostridia bacterium]
MTKITVGTNKNYDIIIQRGLSGLKEFIFSLIKGEKIAVICDDVVDKLYASEIISLLEEKNVVKIVFPHGEQNKNAENYIKIINTLAENKFTRHDTVISLGGGVVGDMGALVASTYMRGIRLIAIPTTILSMVDSSVGGKTAIDLPAGKNLLGTFYQPDGVFINLDFIKSLPEREIKSGYGEIIKYAYLEGEIEPKDLESEISEELVYKCLKIKQKIVEEDEKESSIRKLLNLGHTVGHAIESLANYKISHGECVLMGIEYAINVSKKYFLLSNEKVEKMQKILYSRGEFTKESFDSEKIIEKIKNDKKSSFDGVDFVLLKDVKKPKIVKLTFKELKELI